MLKLAGPAVTLGARHGLVVLGAQQYYSGAIPIWQTFRNDSDTPTWIRPYRAQKPDLKGNYSGTPTSVIPYRALEPDLKVDYLTISTC